MQQPTPFPGEKILIVDDEKVIVELASLLLKKRGFEVFTAGDGKECLDLVEQQRPAVVLLDYMMPVLNGLETLRQIKQYYPDTYVIMFTGKGSEDTAVEIMKAGAADYLQKPFAKNSLQERIDSVLSRRQLDLQNQALLRERETLQREIRKWNSELELRVKQKSLELEQAQKEITKAEKLATLGHVIAGMAHDIRNPLNSINLYAELLKSGDSLTGEQAEFIDKIADEVEHIETILRKMLDSGVTQQPLREPFSLPQLLRSVLHDYQPRISSQKISLLAQITDSCPLFHGNQHEFEQVFVNLISNALFEMPDGGVLKVSLSAADNRLRIVVQDSGKGIAQGFEQQIFEPFFTTKDKGTGFGLSVVRRVVRTYGGTVQARNCQGLGACFTIEMPLLTISESH